MSAAGFRSGSVESEMSDADVSSSIQSMSLVAAAAAAAASHRPDSAAPLPTITSVTQSRSGVVDEEEEIQGLLATGSDRVVNSEDSPADRKPSNFQGLGMVACLFFLSLPYGFNAIKKDMLAAGLYAFKCGGDLQFTPSSAISVLNVTGYPVMTVTPSVGESSAPCDERLELVDTLMTATLYGLNAGAFPLGLLSDVMPLFYIQLATAVLASLLIALFGVALLLSGQLQVVLTFISFMIGILCTLILMLFFLKLAGNGTSTSRGGSGFSINAQAMNSLFAVAFDCSSIVLLGISLLVRKVPLWSLLVGYGILVLCSSLAFLLLGLPDWARSLPSVPLSRFWTIFRGIKLSPPLLTALPAMAFFITTQYLYFGTVVEQVIWLGSDHETAETHGFWFTLMFTFLSLVSGLAFAFALDRLQPRFPRSWPWIGFAGSSVLALVSGAMSLLPSVSLQYATNAVYIVWRILTWCLYYCFVNAYSPKETFGTIFTAIVSVSGLIALFLNFPYAVLNVLIVKGQVIPVNVSMFGGCTLSFAALALSCFIHPPPSA